MSAGKERVDLYDDRQVVEACVAALGGFERPQTASSLETQLRRDGLYTHRERIAALLSDAESLLVVERALPTSRHGVVSPRWKAGPVRALPPGDFKALVAVAQGRPTAEPRLPSPATPEEHMARLCDAIDRIEALGDRLSALIKETSAPGPLFRRNGSH